MTQTTTKRPVATWKKITVTGAILLGVGALATGGAFAVFTSSGTATLAANAGSLNIVMTGAYTVANLAPGDQVQRLLPITLPNAANNGQLVSSVKFFYGVTSDTVGTTDPDTGVGTGQSLVSGINGLTYKVLTCSVAWTTVTSPTVASGAYSCDAPATQTVTASGKLSAINSVATALTLTPADFGVTPTANGTFPTDSGDISLNTLIQLDLPSEADNNYENAATSLTFTAAAIQRDGIQK